MRGKSLPLLPLLLWCERLGLHRPGLHPTSTGAVTLRHSRESNRWFPDGLRGDNPMTGKPGWLAGLALCLLAVSSGADMAGHFDSLDAMIKRSDVILLVRIREHIQ